MRKDQSIDYYLRYAGTKAQFEDYLGRQCRWTPPVGTTAHEWSVEAQSQAGIPLSMHPKWRRPKVVFVGHNEVWWPNHIGGVGIVYIQAKPIREAV